ncbi:MAG: molybdopterin-dependent oxidoreductase, partial [Coriobacteriales bacterium]|nr:molybdopterin-dependent oxidoreductase [Coriobacteriales bacterium]
MPKLNFPEVSSPAVSELADGTKVYRTCSAGFGCHNLGCGLKVFVKDGELVKVEGDREHPISKGRLCVRCLTAKEHFYHPDRILHPLKRAGKRGENKWQQISWDEALDTIVENYTRIRDTYGVNSTTAWNGTGRENSKYHFAMTQDVFGS